MPKLYIVVEGEGIGTKRINDFMFQMQQQFRPDLVFEREGDAVAHAQKLAGEKIGKEIFIMESKLAISARKPQIITKVFNDKGEFVPA